MTKINMSCGQTMMAAKALANMSQQIYEPIYYPPYWEREEKVIHMLRQVYRTQNDILLLAGSGTYGIEAGFRNVFNAGEKVLVINSGVFGAVGRSLLEIVGAVPIELTFDYGSQIDLDQVRYTLAKDSHIKGLFVVHDETTTGTIQPIRELGAIAAEYNLIYAVDAISSLGGLELETDEWGIDLCFASAQKCLNGPQGLALIAVSTKAWEKIKKRQQVTNSLSLDLEVWKRYHDVKVRDYHRWWQEGGEEPKPVGRAPHEVSPAATLVFGLEGALETLLEEGLEQAIKRQCLSGHAVRQAVLALGLQIVAKSEELASDVATVIKLPQGIDEKEFRAHMWRKYGVAIGNGEIGTDNVRIGTMGLAASPEYVLPTIEAFEKTLIDFNVNIKPATGVAAAKSVFETKEG